MPEANAAIPSTTITGVDVNTDSVRIHYTLSDTASALVRFEITNSSGNIIRTLSESGKPAGSHTIVWDCKDSSGNRVPTDTYKITLMATGAFILSSTETLHDFYIDYDGTIFVTAAGASGNIFWYNSTAYYLGDIGTGLSLNIPWGIAKLDTRTYHGGGDFLVTNYNERKLIIFDIYGNKVTKNLNFEPKCAAFNSTGFLFVISKTSDNCVFVFDPGFANAPVCNPAYSFYVSNPLGLCIDSSDNIYVTGAHHLSIYTPTGSLTGTPFKTIGGITRGSGNNQFDQPT